MAPALCLQLCSKSSPPGTQADRMATTQVTAHQQEGEARGDTAGIESCTPRHWQFLCSGHQFVTHKLFIQCYLIVAPATVSMHHAQAQMERWGPGVQSHLTSERDLMNAHTPHRPPNPSPLYIPASDFTPLHSPTGAPYIHSTTPYCLLHTANLQNGNLCPSPAKAPLPSSL